jgi:hypothetical protein
MERCESCGSWQEYCDCPKEYEHQFNPNDPAHCDACFKEGEARLSANRAHPFKSAYFRMVKQRDELLTACEFAFAFIDCVDWTDQTSSMEADNVKMLLQSAIAKAEEPVKNSHEGAGGR